MFTKGTSCSMNAMSRGEFIVIGREKTLRPKIERKYLHF